MTHDVIRRTAVMWADPPQAGPCHRSQDGAHLAAMHIRDIPTSSACLVPTYRHAHATPFESSIISWEAKRLGREACAYGYRSSGMQRSRGATAYMLAPRRTEARHADWHPRPTHHLHACVQTCREGF